MARSNDRGTLASPDNDGPDRTGSSTRAGDDAPNPVWFKPIMFGLMLIGLAWIITFYVSGTTLPIAQLGDGNILVGFGILFLGFLMTTRWR
ncbi:cell division protein CrgA [Marisediminicola sp. LYQ134]|uniref:cell division protein CrgA n=1 Tax=unclassified Marisediminicola TaxID=2618316 RepID=UPI003983347E